MLKSSIVENHYMGQEGVFFGSLDSWFLEIVLFFSFYNREKKRNKHLLVCFALILLINVFESESLDVEG